MGNTTSFVVLQMLQNASAADTSTLEEFFLKNPPVRTCSFISVLNNANQLLDGIQPLPGIEKTTLSIERENPAS